MESSPRHSLDLNSKSQTMYLPLISQSKMYSIDNSDRNKSTLETAYATKQSSNLTVTTSTMLERKRGNVFQNAFNSLTNILIDQFSKVPVSLNNNFSTTNNTLSVTIVPNEGIISHEFFKTLTCNMDNLSDKIYTQSFQNIEPPMDYLDVLRLNAKARMKNDEFLIMTSDTKFPIVDDSDLCSDTEPIDEIVSEDELISPENIQIPNSPLKESTKEKYSSKIDLISKMWNKMMNGVTDNFRPLSSGSEDCTKRYQTTKTRRKPNFVSSGRGRGRGKSQLRRNGVSQTSLRKARCKHDIQDDLEIWEEFEASNISISSLEENEDLQDVVEAKEPSYFMNFELVDIKPKKTKKTKKKRKDLYVEPESSMQVKYVPECPLEEREANFTIDKTDGRVRLISETSVDSEDSFIVFESTCESDFDNASCSDDDDMSDSETESESECQSENESKSEKETDDDTLTHKVRFNLKPTIHKLIKWDFAYRAARLGPWETMARDRERFKGRITHIGRVIGPILATHVRTKIWKERFATDE